MCVEFYGRFICSITSQTNRVCILRSNKTPGADKSEKIPRLWSQTEIRLISALFTSIQSRRQQINSPHATKWSHPIYRTAFLFQRARRPKKWGINRQDISGAKTTQLISLFPARDFLTDKIAWAQFKRSIPSGRVFLCRRKSLGPQSLKNATDPVCRGILLPGRNKGNCPLNWSGERITKLVTCTWGAHSLR